MRLTTILLFFGCAANVFSLPRVSIVSVPQGGFAPDAETDAAGVIHLAYAVGDNVFYTKASGDGVNFSTPIRVNSESNCSHAAMFRGPDVAVGKDGRAHVIWYSNGYQRKLPGDQWGVLYSHLDQNGAAFVPQRNLNHKPSDNFSIAAGGDGRVAVFWMAGGLFLNESADNGQTFAEPRRIPIADTCECCASRAQFTPDGTLLCAYRDKANNARDMFLLAEPKDSREFARTRLSVTPWRINACPMTGTFIASGRNGVTAAWETKGQIYFARCDAVGRKTASAEVALGVRGKYPIALIAPDGTALVTWKRGNDVQWQRFDASDKPLDAMQSAPGNNPHRHAAVVTKNGEFCIFD